MLASKHTLFEEDNFKQIEDIIDSKKLLGQYNIHRNGFHCRYAYSHPSSTNDNFQRYSRFDDTAVINEGDSLNNWHIKRTDSEITVVRVKCSDMTIKRRRSRWDMHDIAIPGDGSHLGDSPSLVNLVTLVNNDTRMLNTEEYLVPLSSWDPYVKLDEYSNDVNCCLESNLSGKLTKCFNERDKEESFNVTEERSDVCGQPSWAGKISKFVKKYCSKQKLIENA